jgi:hypothetical protein
MVEDIKSLVVSPQSALVSTEDVFAETRKNYRHYQKIANDGKTIHLLILHPGAVEDPIYCDLITSSIEDTNTSDFEAVSYC